MFVRPEAEVVLFADELFIATTGEVVVTTTRDPKAPIEGPEEEKLKIFNYLIFGGLLR